MVIWYFYIDEIAMVRVTKTKDKEIENVSTGKLSVCFGFWF